MHRVSDLVGKPIVSAANGERVGRVADVLLDRESCRTVGLVLAGGLMSSEHVLPYSDVQVVGKDAIVARSGEGLMGPKQWRAQGVDTARSSSLRNKRVMTSTGRQLGAVNDVYLDEATGAVEALEVSGSRMGGLMQRKSVLPQSAALTIGPDAIVVSEDTALDFERRER
jgi:uncharacterized protein YrrD